MARSAPPIGPIGFVLPTFPQDTPLAGAAEAVLGPDFDPIDALPSICRQAEQLGAGALWACDHLFWHGPCLESHDDTDAGGDRHRRAALGTCVIQLPLRRPGGGETSGDPSVA